MDRNCCRIGARGGPRAVGLGLHSTGRQFLIGRSVGVTTPAHDSVLMGETMGLLDQAAESETGPPIRSGSSGSWAPGSCAAGTTSSKSAATRSGSSRCSHSGCTRTLLHRPPAVARLLDLHAQGEPRATLSRLQRATSPICCGLSAVHSACMARSKWTYTTWWERRGGDQPDPAQTRLGGLARAECPTTCSWVGNTEMGLTDRDRLRQLRLHALEALSGICEPSATWPLASRLRSSRVSVGRYAKSAHRAVIRAHLERQPDRGAAALDPPSSPPARRARRGATSLAAELFASIGSFCPHSRSRLLVGGSMATPPRRSDMPRAEVTINVWSSSTGSTK